MRSCVRPVLLFPNRHHERPLYHCSYHIWHCKACTYKDCILYRRQLQWHATSFFCRQYPLYSRATNGGTSVRWKSSISPHTRDCGRRRRRTTGSKMMPNRNSEMHDSRIQRAWGRGPNSNRGGQTVPRRPERNTRIDGNAVYENSLVWSVTLRAVRSVSAGHRPTHGKRCRPTGTRQSAPAAECRSQWARSPDAGAASWNL
jgi:hypothetical protein